MSIIATIRSERDSSRAVEKVIPDFTELTNHLTGDVRGAIIVSSSHGRHSHLTISVPDGVVTALQQAGWGGAKR